MSQRRLPDDIFKKVREVQKPNTSRLFLAIFPPEEYIAYFRDVFRALDKQKRNLKFTPVDQIHLTVKFIGGEVSFNSRDKILEDLTNHQGDFIKPEITVKNIQFGFPYQQDPQHVMAALEESPDLTTLYNQIHSEIKNLGLWDTIRWKGKNTDNYHITLGRVKPKKSRSTGRLIDEQVKQIKVVPPKPFVAEYIDLVESILTPGSLTYRKVGKIKL